MRSPSRVRAVLSAASVLLLASAPAGAQMPSQPGPWPVPGGDSAHVGVADGPAPPYRIAWEADVEGTPLAGPVAGEEIVVVVTRDAVVALDPVLGEEVWSIERERGSGGPAALGPDLVLYAEGRGPEAELVAVSPEDGSPVWRSPIEGNYSGGMALSERRVFLGVRSGEALAFELEDGSPAWSFEAVGRVESAPAVAEGRLYFTSQNFSDRRGRVHALDAESGDELWNFEPEGNVIGFSSPSVSGGVVYVGTGDLRARALTAEDGSERWETRLRAPFGAPLTPSVPGDLVIGDVLGHVYRLDAETGEIVWVFRVPGLLTRGGIAVSGDAVLVGDESGQASAIDLDSGLLTWKTTLGDERVGEAAVSGDRIYLAPKDGPVVALEHDPEGALLEEPSPTTLFLGRALLSYAAAFAIVLAGLLGVSRLIPRRFQRED